MRNKVIQKQKQVKEMIAAHERRVEELTVQLQQQYDPNKDSPRRNELKRKAQVLRGWWWLLGKFRVLPRAYDEKLTSTTCCRPLKRCLKP